ncbi:MAG: hypothetical protein ACR2GY_13440 [Phycisphaerales bacterium]
MGGVFVIQGRYFLKNYLQIPYDQPVPEDLVRRIAEHQLQAVREREDDSFW